MSSAPPIVGAKFRPPASFILSQLGDGEGLRLEREPSNPYDANAIKVLLDPGWHIAYGDGIIFDIEEQCTLLGCAMPDITQPIHLGYIPADIAKQWAPTFDEALADGTPFPRATLSFNTKGAPCVQLSIP